MIQSTAYVVVPGVDYQYHFCGVISIQHTFTSQVASGSDSAKEAVMPDFSGFSVNLGTLDAPVASPAPAANVQAPVNITVNPAAAQPEAVARSVYNLAERYLVKTLKSV